MIAKMVHLGTITFPYFPVPQEHDLRLVLASSFRTLVLCLSSILVLISSAISINFFQLS